MPGIKDSQLLATDRWLSLTNFRIVPVVSFPRTDAARIAASNSAGLPFAASSFSESAVNAGLHSAARLATPIEEKGTWPRLSGGVDADPKIKETKNMKYKSELIVAACVAALAFGPASLSAAGKKKSEASASGSPAEAMTSATAPPAKVVPFHGTVSEVDQAAKTFTIAGKTKSRVFKLTDRSVIMKGSTTGSMSDIAQNDQVGGSYWKMPDGSLEVKTVKVGAMGTAEKGMTEKKEKKAKKMKESASPKASPSS
jgi:hypothetical protein